MKKTKTAISVFMRVGLLVLLLVLLFGVLGVTFKYIGNGQRNFYVKFGNETIISEKKGVELPKDKFTVFYCDTLTGQTVDYDVQIFLNVSVIENFDFSVEDSRKNFKSDFASYDCSILFKVLKTETYFMIAVPNGLTVEKVIQSKYPEKTMTGIPDLALSFKDSFILTVTDGVEKLKTQIYFY